MGCRAVVTRVTSVVFVRLGYLTAGFGSMTLSLHDVAASDTVPLGIVVLYRLSCAAAAFYTLMRIFFDQRGLEMRYHSAIIHLRHFRRFTTFTVWCFILLFCYFALAAYCSSALLTGHEEAVPDVVVTATLILFEISYPMSLLVTTVVSFVLLPTAIKHGYPVARMFRFRPQMMHNGNVVMMQLCYFFLDLVPSNGRVLLFFLGLSPAPCGFDVSRAVYCPPVLLWDQLSRFGYCPSRNLALVDLSMHDADHALYDTLPPACGGQYAASYAVRGRTDPCKIRYNHLAKILVSQRCVPPVMAADEACWLDL